MRVSSIKIMACSLLLTAGVAFADAVSAEALASGGAFVRDNQLGEIRDILRGGRGGYIDFGFNFIPSVTHTPLKTQLGEHDGFAFRNHMAGFAAGEVKKDNFLGFLLWFERSGWDGEDFVLLPQYNDFSAVRSVTTWGFTYTHRTLDLTAAAGMQHQNVEYVGDIYPDENDSLLYSWAHLRWGHASVQGSFHRSDWRSLRISLDLESRAIYGGRKGGPLTYLPNFDVSLYNGGENGDDSVRVSWEQNLFAQQLYGEVSFDFPSREFHSAALKYYPDPSRMIGFEATCLRRHVRSGSADLLWGGAVDLLFLRLAYNSSYEYEHLFHAKGTVIAELKFSLATIDGFLFGRGAAQTAPMETVKLEKKNSKDDSLFGSKNGENMRTIDAKTIEAKGVRRESSGATEGGK